jgi:2'-5' RNA ligase
VADVDRPWRCFVAVPVDHVLRKTLLGVARDLRGRAGADAWRWTDAEAWHMTLAFMGSTDPASIPTVVSSIKSVADRHEAFALDAGGLGGFPSRGRARVLWYGVSDPDGRLRRLAGAVRVAVGLEDDERFRGHLTLARARDRFGTDASSLTAVPVPGSRLEVDRLVLYRSHLRRGPARYEALATAALRGATS